jgi:hypothetical protein
MTSLTRHPTPHNMSSRPRQRSVRASGPRTRPVRVTAVRARLLPDQGRGDRRRTGRFAVRPGTPQDYRQAEPPRPARAS